VEDKINRDKEKCRASKIALNYEEYKDMRSAAELKMHMHENTLKHKQQEYANKVNIFKQEVSFKKQLT